MKHSLQDLIIDKYYVSKHKDLIADYYFKFKKYDHRYIYGDGFEIEAIHNSFKFKELKDNVFSRISWIDECEMFEEAYLKDILHILPDSNIDKRNYLRKNKINTLLCL